MTTPTDKFSQTAPISNGKPAGGEVKPTRQPVILQRPAPTKDDFGGYERI
jgi:hypothetical protein